LKKTEKFTIVGVSIAGGVCHNLGQIIVAVIVLENIRIASIFPFLMVSGVVSGIAIGLLGGLLFKKIKILQTNVRV
jgi:heptaprenyl diphosphate synthase